MRLLIVEDNTDFQKFLRIRLEEKCFAVDTADDGESGMALARENPYDLILLDYSLPRRNGYEVCAELRQEDNHTPIIMISGTAEAPHKVEGFSLGIDDYVVKPFFFDELDARIRAVVRRPKLQSAKVLWLDSLSVDITKQKVMRGETSIYLTRKEFALLEYMLHRPGTVLSRSEILEHVWDASVDIFSNTIETHIMNLRKKIDLPRKRKLIHSMPGRGYKIDLRK